MAIRDDDDDVGVARQSLILEKELGRRFTLRLIYLVMGFVGFLVGLGLSILGYAGAIDFQLSMGSVFQARLGNAGPGLIIAILGLAYSWIAATGFRIESSFRDQAVDAAFLALSGRDRG